MDYEGWWNDGQRAPRAGARSAARPPPRRLIRRGDHILTELPIARLNLAEEVYAGQPVRFTHDDWPDARLTVDDHALVPKLTAAEPRLGRRYHGAHGALHRLLIWGGALVGTVAALFGFVHSGAEPIAAMVPLEWEENLGRATMADFAGEYGVCNQEPGVAHIQRLADELAAHARSPYRFTVHLLRGDEVNAFVLPGGQVAIFQGLVQQAEGPNELTGVLAHEVGHGVVRHPIVPTGCRTSSIGSRTPTLPHRACSP